MSFSPLGGNEQSAVCDEEARCCRVWGGCPNKRFSAFWPQDKMLKMRRIRHISLNFRLAEGPEMPIRNDLGK